MLLILTFVTGVAIIPFAIYRIIQKNWYMVTLDVVLILGMVITFVYIYKTNNTKYANILSVLLALIASAVSFYILGGAIVNWIFPAMMTIFFVVPPRLAIFVNIIVFFVYLPKMLVVFIPSDIAILTISVVITNIIAFSFTRGLKDQERKLIKLASEDYLTSTGNRRALNRSITELHKTLENHDKTASLLLLDLDHFKRFNDSYGHMEGDKILVQLAELLKKFYGNRAQIFRYGGEEFLIICTECDLETAYKDADELRKKVKREVIKEEHVLTISIGVAEYIKEESNVDWIHRVDLALYQAKNQGRDRVIKA